MVSTLQTILSVLGLFFGNNPTVAEIEMILPQVLSAIANAKSGQAFSVSFPETVDGVAGTSTFGWAPK